jgi:hypothetical protein
MQCQAILYCVLSIVVFFYCHTHARAAETTHEQGILGLFTTEKTPGIDGQRFEFSSGASADVECWATYSSLTWALGKPVNTAGLRLRLTGGVSKYSFSSLIEDAKGGVAPIANSGQTGFGDLLGGYQANYGGLWVTALAGAAYDARIVTSGGETVQSFAPKAAVETWLNVHERSWISAYATYSWNRRQYSGSLRFGLRALDSLDLGPETGAVGDVESDRAHAGGFARLTYRGVEMTLSGGMEGDYERMSGYYGALGIFRKF